jgi:hypothetical protein
MKKILGLALLVSLVTGCTGIHHGILGSGNIKNESRDVAAFDSISTEGAFEIEIVCQKPQSLEIQGDDNILPLVGTEVSNKVLHVKNLRGYSVSRPVVLRISIPDLMRLDSSGAGSIQVSGLKNDRFEIHSNGAPTIRASGETKNLNIDANGAGSIETFKLRSAKAMVDTKGVSKVEVNASETLDVTVNGPSTVFYQGRAVVKQTVNGPGSVQKRETEGS